MRHIAMLTAASAVAFAAAGATGKTKDEPKQSEAAAATATTATTEKVAPQLATIRADVARPAEKSRGRASAYDFDSLEPGQSIGVLNKTATQLSSIVSNENRKHKVNKIDANGQPVFKEGTTDPVKVATKRFSVFDVDPATDPDKATARIFRDVL